MALLSCALQALPTTFIVTVNLHTKSSHLTLKKGDNIEKKQLK